MIKLVVTDMDGTLLDDNKNLSPEFFEVHRRLTEKGIHFVVASGRQYYNIISYFEDIKSYLMIFAENGTLIMKDGKELESITISKEEVKELVEFIRNIPTANLVLCGKKSAYIEKENPEFVEQVALYYKKYKVVNDLTNIDDEILKVTISDITGAEENSYPYLKDYINRFKVVVSGDVWIDITDKTANKGRALKDLQEVLGITKEETMAFGDYLNDYEMLGEAEYSFAMENAHEDLKKIAKFSGGDNNKNGVLETIKSYLLD